LARLLGSTLATPLSHASNVASDTWQVSMKRGRSMGSSPRETMPGTQVVADSTPSSRSHSAASPRYSPFG
jgi:hypothetical protein